MITSKHILNLNRLTKTTMLFGGPYSNFQAASAVKSIADNLEIQPNHVICTGDLVAYCGQPEKTVNLIRDWGCHVVTGNCEESVGNDMSDCGCGFEADSVCATLLTSTVHPTQIAYSPVNTGVFC